jgi:hypothetical protein
MVAVDTIMIEAPRLEGDVIGVAKGKAVAELILGDGAVLDPELIQARHELQLAAIGAAEADVV